jgi:hypothetical protein
MKSSTIPTVAATLAPQVKCEVCGNVVTKFMEVKGHRSATKEYLNINLSDPLTAVLAGNEVKIYKQ